MLRLRDGRSGSYAELAANPSVPLRVCAHPPSSGLTGLRVLLVADVLMRIAELRGLQAVTVLAAAALSPERLAELERDASALDIHPWAVSVSPEEAEALLGGPAAVHVTANASGGHDGLLVDVAAAEPGTPPENVDDSLAIRLVLLSHRHDQPVQLTREVLVRAAETLSQWRRSVADWAEEPSRPIPAQAAGEIRAAIDDDLDTAAVLAMLRGLQGDPDVRPGAKFETFVFADRVLSLELMREIGRPRP